MNFWTNKRVAILGASFIGSHLVDWLIKSKVKYIRVVNLTRRNRKYFDAYIEKDLLDFYQLDLKNLENAKIAVDDIDIVFHLAADHGGRGYVDTHQGATASNFLLDGSVFWACKEAKVEKVVYASSGCVYPNYLQTDPSKTVYLKESDMVNQPQDADNMYGWAKLMGEMTLLHYYHDFGLKSVSLRYFTVYGSRAEENHAVIAMIAKAFIGQNPFEVWGNGNQIRNWTHVNDIVGGTLLAAEKIDSAIPINLGTMERIKVIDAAEEILKYTKHNTEIKTLPDKPTGPYNRVADNALAKTLLGWQPKVKFIDGLHHTIDWYWKTKDKNEIRSNLNKLLGERNA